MSRVEGEVHGQRLNAELPLRAGLVAFAGLVLVLAGLWLADWLQQPTTWPVRNVVFEGPFRHVTEAELAQAVAGALRGNFLTVDLGAVKARVQSLPWVYEASVRRKWPWDVEISFTEQQLAARWSAGGWVNRQGDLVQLPGVVPDPGLVQLDGPAGSQGQVLQEYEQLEPILSRAGLRIASVTMNALRGWDIRLGNGIVLVVDNDDPDAKVARFAQVYPGVLQGRPVREVDLRYTNGFAVQWGTPAKSSDSTNEG